MSKLVDLTNSRMQKQSYGGVVVKSMSGLASEAIEWIWPDMIARQKLHVFAGDSGIGKTSILTSIAATISRGGYFPDCKESCKKGNVVYLSGEDGLQDTIVPRLKASGADMDHMHTLDPMNRDGQMFDLAADLDYLEAVVNDIGDVALWVIDPVTAFCGGRFDNDSVTSVRSITTRLSDFAETTGAAVIALQHITKSSQTNIKNRILGSGAWVHGPRIVLGALVHEGRSLFGKVKANITDTYGVYPFTIDSRNIHDANDVRFIQWEEPHWSNNRLAEFDGGTEQPIRGEKRQVAYGVLRAQLSDGEWHSKKRLVGEVMEEVDVSDATLQRIASELGVQTRRTSSTPSTTEWRLPYSRHLRTYEWCD